MTKYTYLNKILQNGYALWEDHVGCCQAAVGLDEFDHVRSLALGLVGGARHIQGALLLLVLHRHPAARCRHERVRDAQVAVLRSLVQRRSTLLRRHVHVRASWGWGGGHFK